MLDRQKNKPLIKEPEPRAEKSQESQELETGKPVQTGDELDKKADERRKAATAPRRRRSFVGPLVILIIVGGFGYGGYSYWLANRDIESTDDAYTDGNAITISPEVSGRVVSLDVTDNQFVHAGDPLIHIDDRQYAIDRDLAEGALATARAQLAGFQFAADVARKNFPAALALARGQLAFAQATLGKAEADYKRQQTLPHAATTQQEVDAATAAWHQAQAQVAQAEAQVRQAEPVEQRIGQATSQVDDLKGQIEQAQARLDQALLNLSRCIVVAPQDGWITKRNVEKGNYVAPGQQILSIVSSKIWVTANFKETQLALMRPGQPVEIRVDAYPELRLEGHVDSIQQGSGSKFTAFPPENATGNFVKIVQRVPVKIAIDTGLDPKLPLPLGISVDPRVKVRER
jgi:membrane fusion protein (multidrug efflux system)